MIFKSKPYSHEPDLLKNKITINKQFLNNYETSPPLPIIPNYHLCNNHHYFPNLYYCHYHQSQI